MLYDESNKAYKIARKKMGRPAYIPNDTDYKLVRALAVGRGRSHDYIARYIGITRSTLLKYYSDLLHETKDTRNEEVENSLYIQAAVKQEFRATAYYLEKNYREKYGQDPSGEVDQSEFLAAISKVLKPGVTTIDKVNPEPVDNQGNEAGKVGESE
jgi:hypothetical protein